MKTAEELIEAAEALLLDFDGPITALMPSPLNADAADMARAALADVELPPEIQATTDHLTVLRWTVEHSADHVVTVERACTDAEVECARRSEPSPEIWGLLRGAGERNARVAIVSNNSEDAARAFMERFPRSDAVGVYACRTQDAVHLLKPNPFLVNTAIQRLGVDPSRCVFIGDSVSDVQAGRSARVPVVGLAKSRARGDQLTAAGADALLAR